MINCLILDDEQAAINVLIRYVEETPYLKLAGSTTSISQAIDIVSQQSVDLIFLDIQMPLLNGLQFIDLYGNQVKVILTTAYSEYALEGYERNVIDYLLKPIPFNRFLKAAEKALNFFNRNNPVIALSPEQTEMDFILVKTEHKGKLRKINFSDIVYVEGLKNYVSIYTNQRERIVTYSGISELEERLPASVFIRVHRSYIVAIRMITAIDGNEILLKEAPRIPISGKFKEDLLMKLQKAILQNKSE